MSKQICNICNEEKTIDLFSYRKDNEQYRKDCKACCSKRNLVKANERTKNIIEKNNHDYNIIFQKKKLCPKCNKYKLGKFFHKTVSRADGLQYMCKKCDKKYSQDRIYDSNNYVVTAEQENTIIRKCVECNIEKLLKFFGSGNALYGRKIKCKECMNKKTANRRNTKEGKLYLYKYTAKSRSIEWLLTNDEFESFWQKSCSYCGDEILYIGIDRIDNNLPYKMENVVSCCFECNKMKTDTVKEKWLAKMQKILDFVKSQEK